MNDQITTVTLAGQRYVILPEAVYERMRTKVSDSTEPPLPAADAHGNYPAVEAARVVLARKILRRRRAAGLSQVELANRAGVRVETLNRLEHAKHAPNVITVKKIVRALEAAETQQGE
ncbi:MAG TPA: helix-turn-helix transcriptional regulator [Pirellulales bacterium]|jgi:ribosome-binding protein aMBF1 (putative translation factor)|nr:helix-turn-helix transcriptional regulator [Pirellulales bacterium]